MKRLIFPFFLFVTAIVRSGAQDTSNVLNGRLFEAIFAQKLDSVVYYLDKGADVNAKNIYGITPLLYAVDMGNYDLAKLLIDRGADVNYLPPYDPPAIAGAIIHNRDTILKLLLESGADPDLKDKFGYTPLAYAIYFGNYYAADLLLFYGANPDLRFNTWAPLDLACYYDDTLLVNMLLYYGVNVNTSDSAGFTPLHICAQQDAGNSAGILLRNRANINAVNSEKVTPVSMAVYTRSNRVLDTLMPYRPDLNVKVLDRYYPSAVAVLVQNYRGKRILGKYEKVKYSPVFNYTVGLATLVNYQDVFAGMQFGFKELVWNVDFNVGLIGRLTPCRVVFQTGDNTYIQLWEKRMFFYGELVKNFYVASVKKSNLYLRTGAKLAYTYASYRGSLMKSTDLFARPKAGFAFDASNFIFTFDLEYYKLDGINHFPGYLNFGVIFRISPYTLNLTQKRFYLRNEPVF